MSFWDRLFRPKASAVYPSSSIRADSAAWAALFGGYSGVTEANALAVSSVYACVNLIAGAIATLPVHIYRRAPDGDRTRINNSPLWWMLNEQFTPRWQAASGWEFLVASLLLRGDAFAEILRGPGGSIRGLVPIHPQRVSVTPTPDGARLVYDVAPDPTIPNAGPRRVVDMDDMLHVPGFGFDGCRGLSPLSHALRMTGGVAIATQTFAAKFFENGARPDYVLQTPGALSPQQVTDLRDQIEDRHKGSANAGKPMLLQGGLTVQPLSMPLEEMQLLESRRFQVEEIARVFGVPPFMIGHNEKTTSWGSGVEAMGIGFVRYTLRPYLNKFTNEINRKFFRQASPVAEFDTTELERADTSSLYQALRIGLGRAGEPAFLSVEEARRILSLPREMAGGPPPMEEVDDAPAQSPAE